MSKTVLIIGAGSDIAKAIAARYAKAGYNLILTGRRPEELNRNAKDLAVRYEIKAETRALDVLDFNAHHAFFQTLDPVPDEVVCAAGYLGDQERAEKDPEEAWLIMETNYTGCASVLNYVANAMEERGNGTIIGISSVAGDRGRKSNYFYGSSKAGFSAYLSGLRSRMQKKGIHVLTVKPGFVATRMTEGMDLPGILTASPDKVANDVLKAAAGKRNVLYTKWFWKYIMLIIKLIPEPLFKRSNL